MAKSIYMKRWENAKRIATEINLLLDSGWIILDEDGISLNGRFEIRGEEEIVFRVSKNFSHIYCVNDPHYDNGILTPVKEYNRKFSRWKFVHPSGAVGLAEAVRLSRVVEAVMERTV